MRLWLGSVYYTLCDLASQSCDVAKRPRLAVMQMLWPAWPMWHARPGSLGPGPAGLPAQAGPASTLRSS